MGRINYSIYENDSFGVHSVYAKPVLNSPTPTFDQVCENACKNTTYEITVMKACVREYMNSVKEYAGLGFRVPLGEGFLFIYPTLDCSLKDIVNASTGETTVVTKDMLNIKTAKTRLGCTVSKKFSEEFAKDISWTKYGRNIEEDETGEDITQNETPADTSTGGQTPANGGDNIPAGNG